MSNKWPVKPKGAIHCPECDAPKSAVIDTRGSDIQGQRAIIRRRECGTCDHRWTTYEVDRELLQAIMDELKAYRDKATLNRAVDLRIHKRKDTGPARTRFAA